ncbi:MAG: RNA polymerase sigma factor [Alphaproteobacteria bacterium]|nr:RNA polymerase sigma factor [Alphaproteobacteria bacterium]MBU1513102.1 RNA polymerase sigma factor [Alphaproteobacteria bacterium]MBU2095210.1 RNA polymerase sigma factor [Alphaproteobacteria bacterium]MBU2150631.1 RNA polymerase sigma factor [Alphaproteobacteria bacterium]MBU2306110.1 RNA polymerase sigma factor [Alphaproteobacteria bacterium]
MADIEQEGWGAIADATARVDIRARAAWLGRHVIPHEPALRSWLRRREVEGLDVDDIIQEVYARLVALYAVDHIENPKTYAFQVASSVMINHIRRLKVVSIESVASFEHLDVADDEPSPERVVADRDELRRLQRALAALPARVGEVFRLRRIEGLSQREVAHRLGVAESTVEKHMARGAVLMAGWFKTGGNEPPPTSKTVIRRLMPNHGQGNG